MNEVELRKLFSEYVAGSISEQQHRALQNALKSEPAARAAFREFMDLEAGLRTWAAEQVAPATRAPETRVGPESRRQQASKNQRRWYAISAVATAVTLLVAMSWYWWQRSMPAPPVAELAHDAIVEPPANVGTVLQQENCVWASARSLTAGGRFSAESLSLVAGVAQLKFDSGTDVVMQAPCQLTVVSTDRAQLLEGSIVVRITELSEGFTLMTPNATITDEGTEYAALVDGQATEVHVFDGRVIWEPTAAVTTKTVERIQAGEARRFLRSDPTKGLSVPLRTAAFVRHISTAPSEKARTALIAYDRFESLSGSIGQGGNGVGWAGTWRPGFHGHSRLGTIVSAPNDTVFGLSRAGQKLLELANGQAMHRSFERDLLLDSGSVYYVSLVVQRRPNQAVSGRQLDILLLGNDGYPRRGRPSEIGFGITSEGFPFLKISGTIVQSSPAIEDRTAYLVVAKIAVSNDRIAETNLRVYRDGEAVGRQEPSAWSVVGRPVPCKFSIARIHLAVGNKASYQIDELRIGKSWQSVIGPVAGQE